MTSVLRFLVILTICVSLTHSKTIRILKKSNTENGLLNKALDIPENSNDDEESVELVIQALIDEHEDHIRYLKGVLSTHRDQMNSEDSHLKRHNKSKHSKRFSLFARSQKSKVKDVSGNVPQRDQIDEAIHKQQKHLMNHLRRVFATSLRSRYG